MSREPEKKGRSYSEQLASLELRLQGQIDDPSTVRDIQAAFRTLLAGGSGENDVRAVLQRHFSKGSLRKETFQLVQHMLDCIVSENLSTEPEVWPLDSNMPDDFVDTAVIPGDSFVPVAAEDSLQVGSILRDRFLLQEKAAGGSMGEVYKALDRRLAEAGSDSSSVAIKVLAPKLSRNANALRALQQEAAKGRCLSHPNIVRFIDLDRDDNLYFIVMEWLEGRSLADILDDGRNHSIDSGTAFDIVRQVGQALEYAHRCGVVHADVKPGNIIITPSGQAKLFDFGVARIRQKQHVGQEDFDPGVLNAKTPVYSSMQVLTGEDPVAADDVFSLGCLLYRLLAGYRPFGARNAAEAAEAGMEPQRLQGISQAQWAAVKKSLAYSRVARFGSVGEFLLALDGPGAPAAEDPPLPDFAEPDRPRSAWRFAIPLIVLAALIGAGLAAQQRGVLDQIVDRIATGYAEWEGPNDESVSPTAVDSDVTTSTEEIDSTIDSQQLLEEAPDLMDVGADAAPGIDTDEQTIEGVAETGVDDLPSRIDFSHLPPANLVVTLGKPGSAPFEGNFELTEDAEPAVLEFVRGTNIGLPLALQLEEVSFSGNRSPWESGQYKMQDDGRIQFESGQARRRTTISMSSDPLREPDRDVVLRVRDADYPNSELALLNMTLRDDDQRTFEASLAPNTVAFAVSQVSVRERDPAVQIDVLRFKPDSSELNVAYFVRDVTATEGEDYFAPATGTVTFGPGQRTARIFIPLVQDTVPETDEAFMLELDSPTPANDANIFLRIAVMIRDDDL